jgi:predicted outer membrane repeat protein
MCVLALGVMGCGETTGTGGSGGDGGDGGTGGMAECQGPQDCDDGNECTENNCADGVCESTAVQDGTTCGDGAGTCQTGSCTGTFACTEQGILDAIAVGGGPHTFDCADGTIMVTTGTIVLDNDVILDGEGNLTVDGDLDHTVFEVEDVTAELHGFTVTRGSTPGGGGGILTFGTLTLTNSTVSGNRSGREAGSGIFAFGTLTLTNSTVSGNTGGIFGGAIYSSGTLMLTNSTVSGNNDIGIALGNVTATLTNSTVSGNGGAGIDSRSSGTLTMTNSLIDGDCLGSVTTTLGYNIESPGDTCGFDPDGTDQVSVSAELLKLGELADNGGPTMTHALGEGSVAIDHIPAVDCEVTEDQRGVMRPQGSACDVGAVEMEVQP